MVNRFLSSLLFLAAVNTGIVQAQVVPDGTLPTVVEQLENMRKITGGERVGNNLFHSFEEFSIPEGIEAIFENGLDIENIFTRITGSDISVIDGLLKTAGAANFFLINPNGIVFGENAQLDVGGSFIATTANRIEFADGTNFATRGDEAKVTLTISVPIGLRLDGDNGSITVNGSGNQVTRENLFSPVVKSSNLDGLQVQSGKTLALVGGDVTIKGGTVVAESGQVELASVGSGTVDLDISQDRLSFGYKEVSSFQDIQLSEEALVDASGAGDGVIQVTGANVELKEGSVLLMQNTATSTPGTISVNASDSILLQGESLEGNPSSITTEALSSGDAADIQVSANNFVLRDGGAISTATFDAGESGNVDINVAQKLQLDRTPDGINSGNFRSAIVAFTLADGNVGTISIAAQKLIAERGVSIQSATAGTGNAGDVNLNTRFVELNGATEQDTLFTFINSGTFSTGNAGNVTINTETLRLIDGGAVSSDSIADGNSGNVVVNASDFIEVNGIDSNTGTPSALTSSVTVEEGEAFQSPSIPAGNAGNVSINTPTLNVSQGGTVRVTNQGSGNAGTLTINADNLNLDEAGNITAAAASGNGGNIELNSQNLKLETESQITAEANSDGDGGNITINTTNLTAKKNNRITASADSGDGGNIILNADSVSLNDRDEISAASISGDGGNININTDILTALEQSRITANSISGDGGNITINSRGYFVSEDSVVSASSEFGLDGTININSLENNFQQYLEESEVEIAIIPDFFIPRCANPDRAYLTLFPGDVLRESPDNYYSYPSQTDTDVVLQEPEYQEKLERIVHRYESRLESERRVQAHGAYKLPRPPRKTAPPESNSGVSTSPEPEPEIEEPESESEPESGLIWQPGDPMINATEIVETEDGEVFLVPPAEKQEFLRLLRCGQSVN